MEREHIVGKSINRVDAIEKVTGRAKYVDDLTDNNAYVVRILHSTIAHGYVKSMDISEAEKVEGVVKVVTCFDVPDISFGTAGHPYSTDPAHQDICDRKMLNTHVRYYGDDIAAVVAEDEVAAAQAVRLIKVEYEELPFVLDVLDSLKEDAPVIQEDYPDNILAHTTQIRGDYEEARKEEGLIKVEGWYETPTVQHCHIENFICSSYMEKGRMVVVSSTQIPHIVRRVVGQALGIPWGKVRIIKPYVGGGFGNKQDVLYEPLCAYLSQVCGGRLVKLDCSREETFVSNRVRHAFKAHITSYVRPDGTFVARQMNLYSNQGGYASHGHSVAAKALGAFPQLYPCDNVDAHAYTIYTNRPSAGAMRGYGIPNSMFLYESHADDIAKALGMNPYEFRFKTLMPKGYTDAFSKNCNHEDTFRQVMEKGNAYIDYLNKYEKYKNQTGDIRKGVGLAVFWYNTGVWPISLESSSCRMVLNQDGSVQLQLGETEIGQGADTAFAQMTAETLGFTVDNVHTVSTQDTDITPFGTGAYASRQTYIAGFAIKQTAELLKERIIEAAMDLTRQMRDNLDIINNNIVRITDGKVLMSMEELATTRLYSLVTSEHLTAESTYQIKNNAYSFGCTFAEVEVDIPACKVKLENIINVHDCGRLINPKIAQAQVHGGMSMGIGYGLSEKLMFDEKTGKVLNNNLLDYKLSTTMDHPHLEGQFIENYEPTSPFGTKALGEPPACSVAPAIRNAVLNATGVAVNEIPLNPHILFDRFVEEGLIK